MLTLPFAILADGGHNTVAAIGDRGEPSATPERPDAAGGGSPSPATIYPRGAASPPTRPTHIAHGADLWSAAARPAGRDADFPLRRSRLRSVSRNYVGQAVASQRGAALRWHCTPKPAVTDRGYSALAVAAAGLSTVVRTSGTVDGFNGISFFLTEARRTQKFFDRGLCGFRR